MPLRAIVCSFALVLAAVVGAGENAAPAAADAPPATTRPRAVITTSKGAITVELYADEAPETVATFLALADGKRAFTDDRTGAQVTRPFYDGLIFHRVIAGFMIQGGCPKGEGSGGPGFTFKDEINASAIGLDREMLFQQPGDQLNAQCQYDAMIRALQQQVVEPRLRARGLTPQSPREQLKAAVEQQILPELRKMTLQQFYEAIGYRYDAKLPSSHRPLKGCIAMANSGPGTNGSQFFINLVDTPHLTGKHTVFGAVVAGFDVAQAIGGVAVDAQARPREPVTIVSIRSVASPAR